MSEHSICDNVVDSQLQFAAGNVLVVLANGVRRVCVPLAYFHTHERHAAERYAYNAASILFGDIVKGDEKGTWISAAGQGKLWIWGATSNGAYKLRELVEAQVFQPVVKDG